VAESRAIVANSGSRAENVDMPYVIAAVVTALVLVSAITVFQAAQKTKTKLSVRSAAENPYAIEPTPEMWKAELEDNEEVMRVLEAAVRASGHFRTEMIPDLISNLTRGTKPFARLNTRVVFGSDDFLTVDEKRRLGLCTRKKYSRRLISYFNPACLGTIEPKSLLENMHLDAYFRIARKRDLIRIREMGSCRQVRIVPLGVRDCTAIRRFKRVHDIDDVPGLPLPGCDATCCRCEYQAVIRR
jgi:hypothetical protein